MSKKMMDEKGPPVEGVEGGMPEGLPGAAEFLDGCLDEDAAALLGVKPAAAKAEADEAAQLKDRLLRLQADFDNYRKRMAREFIENRQQASKDIAEAMLMPLDHLDHALLSMAKLSGEQDPSYQGVKLVKAEFRTVLEKFGLKVIETQGKAFDPAQHEALGVVPTEGAKEGDIVAEVRAGYTLGGRVLRAAQVMVAQ